MLLVTDLPGAQFEPGVLFGTIKETKLVSDR